MLNYDIAEKLFSKEPIFEKKAFSKNAYAIILQNLINRFYNYNLYCLNNLQRGSISLKDFVNIPNNKKRINVKVKKWCYEIITSSDPSRHKLDKRLWDSNIIQQMLRENHGIYIDNKSVDKLLKELNFIPYNPLYIANLKNPLALQYWEINLFPNIVSLAKKKKAKIFFIDESTLIKKNKISLLNNSKSKKPLYISREDLDINMMSSITLDGKLQFKMIKGDIKIIHFIDFLNRLIEDTPSKVFIIVNQNKYYYTDEIQEFLYQNKNKINIFYLPKHKPVNTSQVWNHKRFLFGESIIKKNNHMTKKIQDTLHNLKLKLINFINSMGFFNYSSSLQNDIDEQANVGNDKVQFRNINYSKPTRISISINNNQLIKRYCGNKNTDLNPPTVAKFTSYNSTIKSKLNQVDQSKAIESKTINRETIKSSLEDKPKNSILRKEIFNKIFRKRQGNSTNNNTTNMNNYHQENNNNYSKEIKKDPAHLLYDKYVKPRLEKEMAQGQDENSIDKLDAAYNAYFRATKKQNVSSNVNKLINKRTKNFNNIPAQNTIAQNIPAYNIHSSNIFSQYIPTQNISSNNPIANSILNNRISIDHNLDNNNAIEILRNNKKIHKQDMNKYNHDEAGNPKVSEQLQSNFINKNIEEIDNQEKTDEDEFDSIIDSILA